MAFINKYADIGATYDIQDARINDLSSATTGLVLTMQSDGTVSALNPQGGGGSGIFIINAIGDLATAEEGIITNFTVDKTWEDVKTAFNTYGPAMILNCKFSANNNKDTLTYIMPALPVVLTTDADGTLNLVMFEHTFAPIEGGVGEISASYKFVDGVVDSSGWVIKMMAGI